MAHCIELVLEVLAAVALLVEVLLVVPVVAQADKQVPFVVLLAVVVLAQLVVVHYPKTVVLVEVLVVADRHLGTAGFVHPGTVDHLDRCYLSPSFAVQKQ